MWKRTEDGSVVDEEDNVIFFSTERFIRDICLGNCCFICGAHPSEKEFNNEHVIPKWLLRKYDLSARRVVLPNGAGLRYDRYTVPCCEECNSQMGVEVETPISELVRGGMAAVEAHLRTQGSIKLFVWMGLIFLKTHLKDRAFRQHFDARKETGSIADDYDWELLHHLHTVVRSFCGWTFLEKEVFGSLLVLPARCEMTDDSFDFGDLYLAQTMMLRFDEMALFVVFNDSCRALSYFMKKFERIIGPLSELQLREVMAELAFLNLHLKDRPTYHSEFDFQAEKHVIKATLPKLLELEDLQWKIRGDLMNQALIQFVPHVSTPSMTHDEILATIKSGRMTFIFDNEGKFIEDGQRRTQISSRRES